MSIIALIRGMCGAGDKLGLWADQVGWNCIRPGWVTKCGSLQKADDALSTTPKDAYVSVGNGALLCGAQGSSVPTRPRDTGGGADDVAAGSCQHPASLGAGMGWWQLPCWGGTVH